MDQVLRTVFGKKYDESLLDSVTDYELSVENSMLVPRQELVAWLRELHEYGRKILLISDIYLPASHLERLVEHGGFADCVDGIISSADTFLAKASGKAYPYIMERFSLDKNSWLHIGDNPISDGLRPLEFGIQALVLQDYAERQRKTIVKRHINYSAGKPFWRGRALLQLMQPHEGENIPQPDLYIEGYNFLAPMIGAFVQHLAEESLKLGITKIFFLSREGWTFKRFWEKCTPILFPGITLPETEYLYASRMALAGSSCAYQGLTRTNFDISFLPPGNKDFRDVCRIFNLDGKALEPHLARYGLRCDTVLSPVHEGFMAEYRQQMNELLDDDAFQEEIRIQTEPANQAMMRYFEDIGFFGHEHVALVDIGWLGTIQRFLYEAVSHRPDCPRCQGFLFGATRGLVYPTSPKNSIRGIIYDRHEFDFAASSILYARDLFEEACRAPHPTLNGYALTDDGYELEFRKTDDSLGQAEQVQDSYYAPLQEGIFAAAERYAAASRLLGFSLVDYRPWLNYTMVSKLAFPKSSEIANIKHKYHLDDFHGTHKPMQAFTKREKSLWSSSMLQLRFNPLLRLKYFNTHIRMVLNG